VNRGVEKKNEILSGIGRGAEMQEKYDVQKG